MHEGVEVRIPAGDGAPETPAYAILPPGARRGVVVIHEIFGRRPEIDRVVERFADAGYAAVAPDLMDRGRFRCLREVFGAIRKGTADIVAVRQGNHARAWLCEQTGLPAERVGLIGFCFGGGYALLAGSGWAAVSANYGPVPKAEAMRDLGPVIACYGSRDFGMRKEPERLRQRLAEVGHEPAELHMFDAGHCFLTDKPMKLLTFMPGAAIGDYPEARAEGWQHILGFFDRHLADRPPV
ncbi:MAG: dienelactone hydrolase family protein [Acidobacteriota bacterium]